MTTALFKPTPLVVSLAMALLAFAAGTVQAADMSVMKSEYEFKKPKMIAIDGDVSLDQNGKSDPVNYSGGKALFGFEGISQYDAALVGRNFIPPDTMGAVGKSQYFATTNGVYAVYDKATGARTSIMSDTAFWAAAGQTGTNGDTRVMYNAAAGRWIAVAFGANAKDLQIAVSNTYDATGGWKSVKFEGYAGFGFGATADYPTLALDKNAVYIGTNNFAPIVAGGTNSFRGTTMNVIPMESLFNAAAPTVSNMAQLVTSYTNGDPNNKDRGFAQQGVNSTSATSTVVGNSAFFDDNVRFKVSNLTSSSAAGAAITDFGYTGAALTSVGAARQPSAAITANQRVIDTLGQRISSSVYESGGRLYMLNTGSSADDYARVHYSIVDATTFSLLDEGDLGVGNFDYFQGSIAVNEKGQVVIGYNRSGLSTADLNGDGLSDGNVSFLAQTFNTDASGHLVSSSDELLLKVSLTDDYHNGSTFGNIAAGRQRWGDYSQVSVDPEDTSKFWVIGEFAREYNNAAGGHTGGSGGSRWGTWIAEIDAGAVTAVPEPSTYALMISGMAAIGFIANRRRRAARKLQGA